MKKLIILLAAVIFMTATGCSGTSAETNAPETFAFLDEIYYFYYGGVHGNNYLGEAHSEAIYVFIKFHSDGLVEWVDMGEENLVGACKTNKFYGKYELNGRIVTITLSGNEPVFCTISDDGESISFGSEELYIMESKFESTYQQALCKFD